MVSQVDRPFLENVSGQESCHVIMELNVLLHNAKLNYSYFVMTLKSLKI